MGNYTPSTTSDAWRRERKAAGGRKSVNPKRWGDRELDRLSGDLAGLTIRQQAEALSTSTATVDRMRRALRTRTIGPS